jgi:hypothetical protein
MKETIKIHYEHTDTFGGVANYCWVKRGIIELPVNSSDIVIVRAVKKELGMTGVRCNRIWAHGDNITLKPRRICQIIFITFQE